MWTQLFAGLAVSFLNFGIHAMISAVIVVVTSRTAGRASHLHVSMRVFWLMAVTVLALMCAHLVEVGVWSLLYQWMEVRAGGEMNFEFAFENYVALGYGDAMTDTTRRLLGPMTGLNGMLLIGWSVAIIFEVLRIAEVKFERIKASDR